MEPQNQFQPQNYSPQYPSQQPVQGMPGGPPKQVHKPAGNKKPLLIAAFSVMTLIIIGLVIALVVASSQEKIVEKPIEQKHTDITPATSVEIEAVNNGVAQDIGSLNNAEDFNPAKLTDKALGL